MAREELNWLRTAGWTVQPYTLTRKGRRSLGEQDSAWQRFSRAMTGALEPVT